jgi:hypothetical protein
MPRSRGWTDEQLSAAVASSVKLSEVCAKLGVVPGDYDGLRRHIGRLDLDVSRFRSVPAIRPRPRRWTEQELVEAVTTSCSLAEVMRRLGYQPSGGIYRLLVGHIKRLGLDSSHFTGQSWARGRKLPGRSVLPLSEILVLNSPYTNIGRLRERLIKAGLRERRCAECGLQRWRGQDLPLALDHVNGDHTDNGWPTSVSSVPTATRSPIPGALVTASRRSPTAEARVLGTRQCGFESHRRHIGYKRIVHFPSTRTWRPRCGLRRVSRA